MAGGALWGALSLIFSRLPFLHRAEQIFYCPICDTVLAMSDTRIIQLSGVSTYFGDFQALHDVSLNVGLGERVVVC